MVECKQMAKYKFYVNAGINEPTRSDAEHLSKTKLNQLYVRKT